MSVNCEKNILLSWSNVIKDYFESHVKQRFLFLNYYIAIVPAILIATFYASQHLKNMWLSFSLPLIFMLIVTFIFWKFDDRAKFLIKLSEQVIIQIESKLDLDGNISLFTLEKSETNKKRKSCVLNYFFSYDKCIKAMFIIVFILFIVFLIIINKSIFQ